MPKMEERHRTTETKRSSSSRKQDARNGWRTINLLDHLGKAYSRGLIQPHMPEITPKMHRCQFGALPCRGTREAILLVNEVMDRFRSMARHKKSSQRLLRKMAVLLFDLEKAFDCIPRDRAFSELAKLAGSNDLKLIMEDLHRCTRYLLLVMEQSARNCVYLEECGKDLWKVLWCSWRFTTQSMMRSRIREEVRDCKEFGRATKMNQRKRKSGWTSRRWRSSDDMLSFLVNDTEEDVEVWATRVIKCFETFDMKANVSKLEIMMVAWGMVSKPISRKVARGRLKFNVRGITIKATTSAKYLGTKIDVKASSQKELNARVQVASQAFTRLSGNMWKAGTLSERSKVKAFRTLVLPFFLLYGTECLLLTKQQENNLERWALWKSVLTPFERVNDDPTLACRKTLMGKLSFEHRFLHQTARRTQLQEGIRLCIKSQAKDQEIDTTRDMSHEWIKWLERQPKDAFKCVRTYHGPVSDNH